MTRILVVEDEVPLRRIILLNLIRRGHSVIEADSVASAQEALMVFGYQFDLILLDLNLPDRTGWDVLRLLEQHAGEKHAGERETPRWQRVIVITAARPVRSRLEEFHPAAVLLKPFPIEALLRLVQRVLGAPAIAMTDEARDRYSPSSQELS